MDQTLPPSTSGEELAAFRDHWWQPSDVGLFNKRGDRELIPIGWALALVLGIALAVIGGLLWLAWARLGPPEFVREQVGLSAYLDIVKIVLAVVAGLGGVVALVVAYRRQRTGEQAERREHARLKNERTRLLNERFDIASEKLGNDKPAVRLAGVHAMANLADDWDESEGRQMCIDVLCSYLRMSDTSGTIRPAHHDDEPAEEAPSLDAAARPLKELKDDRETRHTILRTIAAHLRKDGTNVSWSGHDFDLRGITMDRDLDFTGAEFQSGKLDFTDTHVAGGTLQFQDAQFSGGEVLFEDARFSGGRVWFGGTQFSDGIVWFAGTQFSGANVLFGDARFSGGHVWFGDAQFSGGTVGFPRAQFSGGTVWFSGALFSGGAVGFSGAQFSDGQVWFDGTQFSGGHVRFDDAQFSGSDVRFSDAEFCGGAVDFSKSAWHIPPTGLPESTAGLTPPLS